MQVQNFTNVVVFQLKSVFCSELKMFFFMAKLSFWFFSLFLRLTKSCQHLDEVPLVRWTVFDPLTVQG